MATRRRADDSRNRQQWHALTSLLPRRRGHCPWPHHHRIPWRLRHVHCLGADSVQTTASGGYVSLCNHIHLIKSFYSCKTFCVISLIRITLIDKRTYIEYSPQHGRRRYDPLWSLRPGAPQLRDNRLCCIRHRRTTSRRADCSGSAFRE